MQSRSAIEGCCHRWRIGAVLIVVLIVVLIALPGGAVCQSDETSAAMQLVAWRAEAGRVRLLAENDAPRAYDMAKRLQASVPANAMPADRARSLNLLARIETYLALTEPAAAHAQEAFQLAAANGDRVGQAESDLNVALNAVNRAKLDAMLVATEHSVAVLEGVDRPDLLGEAMLRTTAMYHRFDQFDDAVAVAVRAMEIARRSNNPLALAYAHQGLSMVFDRAGRAAEAGEHALQMRAQARAAHSRLLEAFSMTALAGLNARTGDLHGAQQLTREALAAFREVGVPYATSYGLYGLADLLAQGGQHQEAIRQLDEALDIYRRYPNPISEWFALNARSANYQSLRDIAKADADAEQAYELARNLGGAVYLSGSATRRAAIATAKGDYRRAYRLSVEATDSTAKAAREKAEVRVVQLIRRYESQGKQREIDALTRRSEQQAAQLLGRELQQRWLWTLLAGVALALIGAALFVFRLRQSQRQLQALNQQLQRSENDVRALIADLEQRVQLRTQESRQQARYLRTLIDMLPMWAWFKDTHSRYLVVNQAHAAARGHSAEAMVGKSDLHLLAPDLAKQQLADDAEVMASRRRKTTEEWAADNGRGVWMETYKAAVLDEDGTLLGTVGAARDISERKAVEAAREAALSEAQHLARQRSEFLAQMSHELRTPLNAIMGFAQILQRDKTLVERQTRALKIIAESGHHLLTLIDDILDLARIDAAKVELYPSEVNFAVFMEIVCDTIQVKAEDKSLLFTYRAAPGLPDTIRVDEKRLRQILLNLLSNAVKFTDSGRITLRVTRAGAPAVRGGNLVRLRFEVEDEGIGMTQTQMARLFQPFEQVAEVKRREGGSGLGLAISRHLICLMGGDIEVRSQPGEGSVFSFEIDVPASQRQVHAPPVQNVPIGYSGDRRKILVVDDVLENRAMLMEELATLGFVMAEACDGVEALEVAARFQPDLVVMDLTMPVMDGFEATRCLRSSPHSVALPIIATSASATAETEVRSREAGASAFVSKPIQEPVLLRAIAALLRVDWIFDETAAFRLQGSGEDGDVVPPPPDEMEVLRGLALAGNMRSIRDRADHVRGLDPRYAAFAAQLQALADGYQSSAITTMIERYSNNCSGSGSA
jgi:PAS domain S-box-containing protein